MGTATHHHYRSAVERALRSATHGRITLPISAVHVFGSIEGLVKRCSNVPISLTVRRARLSGPVEEFETYLVVKLQNVKSTTIAVKGNEPCWEQEFILCVHSIRSSPY